MENKFQFPVYFFRMNPFECSLAEITEKCIKSFLILLHLEIVSRRKQGFKKIRQYLQNVIQFLLTQQKRDSCTNRRRPQCKLKIRKHFLAFLRRKPLKIWKQWWSIFRAFKRCVHLKKIHSKTWLLKIFYFRQTSKDMEEKIRLFEEQLNIKARKILISGLTSAKNFGKRFARKGIFSSWRGNMSLIEREGKKRYQNILLSYSKR